MVGFDGGAWARFVHLREFPEGIARHLLPFTGGVGDGDGISGVRVGGGGVTIGLRHAERAAEGIVGGLGPDRRRAGCMRHALSVDLADGIAAAGIIDGFGDRGGSHIVAALDFRDTAQAVEGGLHKPGVGGGGDLRRVHAVLIDRVRAVGRGHGLRPVGGVVLYGRALLVGSGLAVHVQRGGPAEVRIEGVRGGDQIGRGVVGRSRGGLADVQVGVNVVAGPQGRTGLIVVAVPTAAGHRLVVDIAAGKVAGAIVLRIVLLNGVGGGDAVRVLVVGVLF